MNVSSNKTYCKIPRISPGLSFVQKAFLPLKRLFGWACFRGSLFSEGYWREFRVSKLVGRDNKNSSKH